MANLSSILSDVNSISDLILVTPKKDVGINPQSIIDGSLLSTQKFLFHVKGEDSITLQSDITDHFVEDNTSIQDQIALKPEMIMTNGYIGELNNVTPEFLEPLKEVADRLSLLSPFLPEVSATALIAYNTADQAYRTGIKAKNAAAAAWSTITGKGDASPVQTEQQKAFRQFYQWYKDRRLFTVQTPWGIFNDMAMLSLRATQGEDSAVITDFEITFKKMRFAQTIITTKATVQSGRAGAASSGQVNNGTTQPKIDVGVLDKISAAGIA